VPRLRLTLALLAVALAAPSTAAADRTVAKAAQLDGDPELEQVERRFVDCPEGTNAPEAPEQCGYIAVVDGGVTHTLTPTTQRPLYDYGWYPGKRVVLRDLTGDGRPEVIWELSTSGGTGSSPRRFGVHRWTESGPVRIFMRQQKRGLRDSVRLPIRLDVLPPRRGLRELRLRELLYDREDSTCCPSFTYTRRFRWNGERMRYVPGSERLRAAGR
jgi:hypothetical protein